MDPRLRDLLTTILLTNRFYAARFAGINPLHADMHELPFTTKAELLADQKAHPPYGSALTYPLARYSRMHQTSGTTTGQPLRWLDTPESWGRMLDSWRVMFAAMGLRRDDRLFFPFSFGPFLGFWTAFEAAVRDGYFVFPGGGMSSSARLRFLIDHAATVVFCTPTYALHLAEVAQREGIELAATPVRLIVVAGEPGGGIAETRRKIESSWGARVIDHSGMTEIGPCAIESADRPGGLQILEECYIAEVIDPATGRPCAAGTVGELVLTNLHRVGSPLIRYRTGDLVRAEPGPGGKTWLAGGILGRVDDMIYLRGNNVYPGAIEAIVRRHPEVAEFRLIVDRKGPLADLRIEIECVPSADESIVVDRIGKAMLDELLFRADVAAVPAGTLPRFEMKAQRLVKKN
jgi:phenylacetate-CoA ligase